MKVKKIIDLCKKRGICTLYDDENENQWISDGSSVYPLFELPYFDIHSLFNTYDFTEKQKEKIFYRHENKLPEEYCLKDCCEDEDLAEPFNIFLKTNDRMLIPYHTSIGLVFVDAKYLEPLKDEEEYLELYERHNGSGIYFAAKVGMILCGIILPFDAIKQDFAEELKDLSDQCNISLFNKESKKEDTV